MSVGEVLAEARYRAGLTLDEVSERSRIREAVIRSIEHDDYDACGGELYVRGYVRAIAGAVGIDAQPLIREYDEGHTSTAAVTRPEVAVPAVAAATSAADPARSAPALAPGQPGQPRQPRQPSPRQPSARKPKQARTRGRRPAWIAALVVIVLAAAGIAAGIVATSPGKAPARDAAASAAPGHPGAARGTAAAKAAPTSGTSGHGAKPATAPAKPKAQTSAAPHPAAAAPVRVLTIGRAVAFGPAGTADGDNPQVARFTITRGATLPWRTDWYTTPHFGLLKKGTGLLLDMGRTVTVTSVRIDLGGYLGADLQLRVGDTAVLSDLHVAARASGAGGTIVLRLRSPVRARYVLIWFTLLPPNGTGRYQATVYRVVVNGRL